MTAAACFLGSLIFLALATWAGAYNYVPLAAGWLLCGLALAGLGRFFGEVDKVASSQRNDDVHKAETESGTAYRATHSKAESTRQAQDTAQVPRQQRRLVKLALAYVSRPAVGLAALLLYVLIGIGWLVWASRQPVPISVGGYPLLVEIADNPKERAIGLSGRESVPDDHGMLFVFEAADYHTFWMKDTHVPLTVAFIDGRGQIVDIQDMTPLSLDYHQAAAPAFCALEVNQGWFPARGIGIGDTLAMGKYGGCTP